MSTAIDAVHEAPETPSGGQPPPEPAPTTIRVIVVHGIGSQKAGSTAARWADSLVRFGRAAGYRPDVSTAKLTGGPAHVTVRLTHPADAPETAPPTVVFAIDEAHWAESFAEPSVGRVLRFLATVAPLLAITQSITIWRTKSELWDGGRARAQPPGRFTARVAPRALAAGHIAAMVAPLALGVLALGVAAPLIAVLLLLLLVGASLPIPSVRRAVGKALGWLSTSIGDAYLFVADPVNRAAMEARLAERLTEKSEKPTVVLAHSQGAALAYRALRTMLVGDRPTSLITVGSGVGRLHQVGLLQTLPWYLTPLFVAVVATAATGIASTHAWLRTGLLLLSALLTLLAWRICAWWLDGSNQSQRDWWQPSWWTRAERCKRKQLRTTGLLDPIEGMNWLDIWASFDPVPNGRAAYDWGAAGRYQLARVAGEQSLVRDHVRYDLDWDQTMPLVLTRLLAPSKTAFPVDYVGVRPRRRLQPAVRGKGEPPQHMDGPEQLRRVPLFARDWWGLVLRTVPLGAVGVALSNVDLFGLGQWLRTAPPGFLDSTVDGVFLPLRTASDFFEAVRWPWEPRPQELLGILTLLALGLAGSVLTRRVLTFLQRRETTAWLRAGGFSDPNGVGRWSPRQWRRRFGLVALAAAVVPAALLLAHTRVHWTAEQTVEAYLTAVAEDDMDAVCEVTAAGVLAGCGTEDTDGLRTCGDARDAVAALQEDAIDVPVRSVTITWAPESAPACDNEAHGPVVPTEVGNDDGNERWKVTAVGPPTP